MFRTKGLWILFCISILMFGMTESVSAAEIQTEAIIGVEGFQKPSSLYDSNRNTYTQCAEQGEIAISNSEGIYSIYIDSFSNYNIFYGNISNILILLMWVYILSYIFVLGMAINASATQRDDYETMQININQKGLSLLL